MPGQAKTLSTKTEPAGFTAGTQVMLDPAQRGGTDALRRRHGQR